MWGNASEWDVGVWCVEVGRVCVDVRFDVPDLMHVYVHYVHIHACLYTTISCTSLCIGQLTSVL